MATANIYFNLTIGIDGVPLTFGSRATPYTIGSLTAKHDATYSLATTTSKTILNLGSGATDDLADFDLVIIYSDQALSVELTGTTTADNSNLKIAATVPFILSTNTTRAYNASGGFAGATQSITKIAVRNDSGTTATFRVLGLT